LSINNHSVYTVRDLLNKAVSDKSGSISSISSQTKKEINMIGAPSTEGTIHKINNQKIIKISRYPLKMNKDGTLPRRSEYVIENLASILVNSLGYPNFSRTDLSFVCGKSDNYYGHTVMPFINGGSLTDNTKSLRMDEKLSWSVLFQTVVSIFLIQKNFKMVHHDLHTHNVMIHYDSNVKTIDYRGGIKLRPYKGVIAKMIDFGFATYEVDDTRYAKMGYSRGIDKDVWGDFNSSFDSAYDIIFFFISAASRFHHKVKHEMEKSLKFWISKGNWKVTERGRPLGTLPKLDVEKIALNIYNNHLPSDLKG